MTTLLIDQERFAESRIEVVGESHRHLFRARRLGPGDRLRVADGVGHARWGRVVSVDRFRASVELAEEAPANEPSLKLDLLIASPRPERASWLVEKTTEIGVHRIRFLNSRRSPRRYGGATLERFGRVAAAALEQCGRSRLPEITANHEWSALSDLLVPADRWLLDPGAAARAPDPTATPLAAALVVGPEGGFTDEERAKLLDLGCRPVALGSRLLRVETAAVVGAAGLLLRPFGC